MKNIYALIDIVEWGECKWFPNRGARPSLCKIPFLQSGIVVSSSQSLSFSVFLSASLWLFLSCQGEVQGLFLSLYLSLSFAVFPFWPETPLPIQHLNSLIITIFVLSFVFESAVKTLEDNETLYVLFCQLSKCVGRGPKDEISFGRRLFANTVGPRRCPDSHNILSLQKRK